MSNPIRPIIKILRKVKLTKLFGNIYSKTVIEKDKRVNLKDTQVCEIFKSSFDRRIKGAKVITVRGYGTVLGWRSKNWFIIGVGKGYGPVEHTPDKLKQYFVKFKQLNGKYKIYPLKFADYAYMDQTKQIIVAEVYITDKKYAALTAKSKEDLEYITFFNRNSKGKDILKKLLDNNYSITKIKN